MPSKCRQGWYSKNW